MNIGDTVYHANHPELEGKLTWTADKLERFWEQAGTSSRQLYEKRHNIPHGTPSVGVRWQHETKEDTFHPEHDIFGATNTSL